MYWDCLLPWLGTECILESSGRTGRSGASLLMIYGSCFHKTLYPINSMLLQLGGPSLHDSVNRTPGGGSFSPPRHRCYRRCWHLRSMQWWHSWELWGLPLCGIGFREVQMHLGRLTGEAVHGCLVIYCRYCLCCWFRFLNPTTIR